MSETAKTAREVIAEHVPLLGMMFQRDPDDPAVTALLRGLDAAGFQIVPKIPNRAARDDGEGNDRWEWVCHVCGGPKENWGLTLDRIAAQK